MNPENWQASSKGGVKAYQVRETSHGPVTRITYNNGDWKDTTCADCWHNWSSARRREARGGKFIPCLSCQHKGRGHAQSFVKYSKSGDKND